MTKSASLFISLFLIGSLYAQVKIPDEFFTAETIKEAQAAARAKDTGIVFVLTRAYSTNEYTTRRTKRAFRYLKKDFIVVYCEDEREGDWRKVVSPLVRGAFYSKKMGGLIPKVIATPPEMDEILAYASARELDEIGNIKKVETNLKKIKAGEMEIPNQSRFNMRWRLKNAKGYRNGRFVALEGKELVLKSLKNETLRYPLSSFSPIAADFARHLQKKKTPTPKAESKPHTWLSKDGRSILATFVKLEGDRITLLLDNDKESRFALELLSPESVKLARELAKKSQP